MLRRSFFLFRSSLVYKNNLYVINNHNYCNINDDFTLPNYLDASGLTDEYNLTKEKHKKAVDKYFSKYPDTDFDGNESNTKEEDKESESDFDQLISDLDEHSDENLDEHSEENLDGENPKENDREELIDALRNSNNFKNKVLHKNMLKQTVEGNLHGKKVRVWKRDAEFLQSDSPVSDYEPLSDVEPEKGKRYETYSKNYAIHESSDDNIGIDDPKRKLKITNKRDFHRHKILTQTGRFKTLNEKKVEYEPGYTPDYLPRLFNISDDSECSNSDSDMKDTLKQLAHTVKHGGPLDKLKHYKSPYFEKINIYSDSESANMDKSIRIGGNVVNPSNRNDDEPDKLGFISEQEESPLDEKGEEKAFFSEEEDKLEKKNDNMYYSTSSENLNSDSDYEIDLKNAEGEEDIVPELSVLHESGIFYQTLIKTGKHCKVTTGGRIFSSSALILIGDGNGIAGLGYGKGSTLSEAMNAALKDAKRKIFVIHRVDNSIAYQTKQKYCRARVYLWPLNKKAGVRCSFQHQELMDLFGLTDIRMKTIGRRNDHNIYKALIKGLQTSETAQMHARRRGKKVWDINKNWRLNNRSRSY